MQRCKIPVTRDCIIPPSTTLLNSSIIVMLRYPCSFHILSCPAVARLSVTSSVFARALALGGSENIAPEFSIVSDIHCWSQAVNATCRPVTVRHKRGHRPYVLDPASPDLVTVVSLRSHQGLLSEHPCLYSPALSAR